MLLRRIVWPTNPGISRHVVLVGCEGPTLIERAILRTLIQIAIETSEGIIIEESIMLRVLMRFRIRDMVMIGITKVGHGQMVTLSRKVAPPSLPAACTPSAISTLPADESRVLSVCLLVWCACEDTASGFLRFV